MSENYNFWCRKKKKNKKRNPTNSTEIEKEKKKKVRIIFLHLGPYYHINNFPQVIFCTKIKAKSATQKGSYYDLTIH